MGESRMDLKYEDKKCVSPREIADAVHSVFNANKEPDHSCGTVQVRGDSKTY